MAAMRGGSVAEKSTVCRVLGVSDEDRLDVLGEAHVEHLVGLVQDHDGHSAELQLLAAHQVEGPSRRGDDDIGPALQGPQLRPVRLPAVDRQHRRSQRAAVAMDRLGNLHGQLAGGHQDQRHGPVAALVSGGKPVQERQGEGRRLARPGRRLAHEVLARQQRRDRLSLDRRRLLVAELDDRLHQAVVEPQGRETRKFRGRGLREPFRPSSRVPSWDKILILSDLVR